MPPFCSTCGGYHYSDQCWGSPKATNFIEITNGGYWNTYTNTYEQSFQDQDLNEFQHREPQFDDFQNYYPMQQQTTDEQLDLVSLIAEFMKSTQSSFRNMEIQLEEMTLKLKSESLENIPDEIGNGYIEENSGEACGEKNLPCPENSVDMREIEITKTLEHDESEKAIELNHEDASEQEKKEMDVMIEDILVVDPVVDLNVDLKASIEVDEKTNVFEVEVIRGREVFVYRLITTKKDYKLRWTLIYCNAIHALVAIEVIELMDECAIYKALDWT
ncbi:PREDICTED: uncharacterized protein LOC105951021 [Erythranthe guttata]|uniref:uncharacterized protein LOC105951021 n=1 Tax=Erythranthe guttata TaxID=4155 RepID=UPI00064D8222|nr:PREDICTED: uncharacterized protein LOC105951021 [Erythranthe guttata]|eukprot:XP_012829867.1 PREDICTED: uncharacterized protein LOC105951021 [Erythranthe guttata]